MTTSAKLLIASAALGLSIAAGGCVVRTGFRTHAYVEQPNLVYVSPGVWVIEDYNEPVFWYGDYYWANRGGVWYRSTYYTGGWVRVHAAPAHIRGIHNPHRYVRYRAPRGVRTRPAPGVRDHRAYPAPRGRDNRGYQPRGNERVPARRAQPPGRSSRPGVNRTYRGGTRKNAPPPHRAPTKSKSKSKPKPSKSKTRSHR